MQREIKECPEKRKITSAWRKEPYNCFVLNIVGSYYQDDSIPDTVVIKDGQHIWIEFKGPETKTEPAQISCHKKMAKNGVNVYIVRFLHEHEWLIEPDFHIKFRMLRDGIKLLYDTLLSLEKSRIGGNYVSENSSLLVSSYNG